MALKWEMGQAHLILVVTVIIVGALIFVARAGDCAWSWDYKDSDCVMRCAGWQQVQC